MEVQYKSSNSIDSIGMPEDDEVLIRSSGEFSVNKYKYRWLILTLYSLTAFSNTLVWLSLYTVTDATSAFYEVKEEHVIWSSVVSTGIQVIIAIPFSFLPSRLGLRTSMVVAASINATGACLIIAGAHNGGFAYFLVGQTTIAVAASILPQLAPEVSAVWFGKNEHAVSTSIGITVGNAGAAFGFLQPALFLKDLDPTTDIDKVGVQIKRIIYSQAALCVVLMLCVVLLFKQKPPKPPSVSQAIRPGPGSISFEDFLKNFRGLVSSRDFLVASHIYALSTMVTFVVPVVLNNIMGWKFPQQDEAVGWMGFGGIIAGIIGSVVFSIILDKTKAFKRLNVVIAFISLGMWVLFVELLDHVAKLWLSITVFIIALLLFIPFGPILVDTMVEITYPIPESTSFAIAITGARLYSIPVTFLAGYLVENNYFYEVAHMFTAIFVICVLLTLVLRVDPKRTLAGQESNILVESVNDMNVSED
jgi:Fucose permease